MEELLHKHYNITEIQKIRRTNNGTQSEVYCVVRRNTNWILRLLESEAQCENYLKIAGNDTSFLTPSLLFTRENKGYIKVGFNQYAVLQEFINEDVEQIINSEHFKRLAQSSYQMKMVLSNLKFTYKEDSFDLLTMYRLLDSNQRCFLKKYGYTEGKIYRTHKVSLVNECSIHGDLGVWNMIVSDGRFRVIDFSELRVGSYYFDFSGAFASSLGECSSVEIQNSFLIFIAELKLCGERVDTKRLLDNIELWLIRGVVALLRTKVKIEFIEKEIQRLNYVMSALTVELLEN